MTVSARDRLEDRMCCVCRRYLQSDEPQTCRHCVDSVRACLGRIEDFYALLPFELHASVYGAPHSGRIGPRSPEKPMPGGRYLTMLAGGSDGATQMTAIIASFSDSKVDASYANDEHATDTPSVSHTLIRWARDWWYVRTGTPHTAGATFMKAARYLAEQNQWAANYHPEYEQYAADLRLVRGYLEMATGLHNRPLRAPVKCFTCGEQALQRRYRDPNPCRHDGDHRTDCDQGGLEDNWRCAACARDYTPAEYLLAVKAKLEAQTDETVTT